MEWEEQTDGVHTPEHHYCDDPTCWCHSDVAYHDLATQSYATADEYAQAIAFYGFAYEYEGRTLYD